jgi:hypothetical protein
VPASTSDIRTIVGLLERQVEQMDQLLALCRPRILVEMEEKSPGGEPDESFNQLYQRLVIRAREGK